MAPRAAASLGWSLPLVVLACGGNPSGPLPSTPRVDYVDGAIEPLLVRGDAVVIEGFGFGDAQGSGAVSFTRAGGGSVAATVAPGGWSERAIRVTVPDSAVSGTLTVTTTNGLQLSSSAHVRPRVAFDPVTLAWQARTALPRAPAGVALTVGAEPSGSELRVALYAAGGAEPVSGDSVLVPDSAVFVARAAPGGSIGPWSRPRDLPAPRAFAAAVLANRYNSRFNGRALFVIGGIDSSGRARATVYRALVAPDTAVDVFTPIEPLPAPVAGAIAVVRRGRIYVIGGTDSVGRPQPNVYVARIGLDGQIDGWYAQPSLPGPRAHGGGVVLDSRVAAFGGIADSAPPGGGLGVAPPRLDAGDTARVSLASGFFTSAWAPAGVVLPEGRSQFATLLLGDVVLVVGGFYGGAPANAAETLAALVAGDSLGGFAGPVGANTIAGQGGGTLVGPAGARWQDADGSHHAIVVGGIDLITRTRRDGAWGF
ncbi:MAG: hypothetical protein ACREMF_05895 [Gemmatimonadales bacterium]